MRRYNTLTGEEGLGPESGHWHVRSKWFSAAAMRKL